MDWRNEAKKRAAVRAVKHVRDGFVVGLGSGSTAAFAIKEIGRGVQEESIRVFGVPTSYQAFMLATEYGIPVTTLNENPKLDLCIDGADEIDRELNLIKGKGGGAIMREKIVASAAEKMLIIADETKLTQMLGTNHPLPLEILPFAERVVSAKLRELGGTPILRERGDRTGPFITDNGNFILDFHLGPIENLSELNLRLKSIPGIIETGLFIGMADIAYVGSATGLKKMVGKRRSSNSTLE
jgi:ribose 5-phosphate isomerase A